MPQQRPRSATKSSVLDSVFERWYKAHRKGNVVDSAVKRDLQRRIDDYERKLRNLKEQLEETSSRATKLAIEVRIDEIKDIIAELREQMQVTQDAVEEDFKKSVARATKEELLEMFKKPDLSTEQKRMIVAKLRRSGFGGELDAKDGPLANWLKEHGFAFASPDHAKDAASGPAREAVEEFYRNAERSGGNAALARTKTKIHFDLSDLKVGSEGNVVSFKVKDRALSKDLGFANLKFEAEDHTASWMVFVTLADGRPYTKINVPKDKAATKAEAIHEAKVMLTSAGRDRSHDARPQLLSKSTYKGCTIEEWLRDDGSKEFLVRKPGSGSYAVGTGKTLAQAMALIDKDDLPGDHAMNRDAKFRVGQHVEYRSLSGGWIPGHIVRVQPSSDITGLRKPGDVEYVIAVDEARGGFKKGFEVTISERREDIIRAADAQLSKDAIQTTYYQHVGRTHNRNLARLRTMMDHNLKTLTVDRVGRITNVKVRDALTEREKRRAWLERQEEELAAIEARKNSPRPGDKERAEELRYRIKSMQGDADPVQMLKSQISRLESKLSSAHNAEERRDIKKEIEELRQELRAASNRDARYEERVLRREIEHLLDNTPGMAPDVTREEFVREAIHAGHSSPMASAMWDLLRRDGFHNFK